MSRKCEEEKVGGRKCLSVCVLWGRCIIPCCVYSSGDHPASGSKEHFGAQRIFFSAWTSPGCQLVVRGCELKRCRLLARFIMLTPTCRSSKRTCKHTALTVLLARRGTSCLEVIRRFRSSEKEYIIILYELMKCWCCYKVVWFWDTFRYVLGARQCFGFVCMLLICLKWTKIICTMDNLSAKWDFMFLCFRILKDKRRNLFTIRLWNVLLSGKQSRISEVLWIR